MVDGDASGQLSPQEFVTMHAHLRAAHMSYMQHDTDRSGILTLNEIAPAIAALGFTLDMAPTGSFYTLCKAFDLCALLPQLACLLPRPLR